MVDLPLLELLCDPDVILTEDEARRLVYARRRMARATSPAQAPSTTSHGAYQGAGVRASQTPPAPARHRHF